MEWIKFFRNQKALIVSVLLMSFVVTTTGVNIDAHFCRGKLKSIALFKKAKTCSKKKEDKVVDFSNDSSNRLHKKSCCGYGNVYAKQILETKSDFSVIHLGVNNNALLSFNQFFEKRLGVVNDCLIAGIKIKPPDYVFISVSRTILYQIFRN